ncbi:CYTH domain-containing protein [Lactococcus carnosus]|uniref:CYTH domain-containing protein n=1 Tax=Pseudolactococcus carnosus TaxID=2749961 RepID=UPI0015DC4273|nr:CYTH domain-containing protein [Lactococcus carnosus]MCJ1981315.1 CYTH domain-containing protein [Lactococcus carnosus]MCJ1988065.1 CYTH domain-containing protein [Lactococcus carnosus]MCJ2004982.1 CYTH domain-containing protein [Lactococcus carnosus]QDJ26482.1 adenylate cyclase [Lactococcus carnosus]
MKTNLEIEYKTLLSLSEFDQLSKRFNHIKPIRQTNHYFDTPDLKLRKNKLSLRIRIFSDAAEMTLKIPQRVGNMEHNLALTSQQAAAILKADSLLGHGALLQSMLDLLDQYTINLDAIHTLGSLTTTRREYQTPIGLMALDRNEYTNKVDYELELEVEDAGLGEQNFNTFLKENKIEYRYARSKVVRFLESIGKMS